MPAPEPDRAQHCRACRASWSGRGPVLQGGEAGGGWEEVAAGSDVENSNFLKIKKQRNTQRVLCFHILETEKIQIVL